MHFRIFFFYKNSIRILIGVLIESIDHLGRTDILTILNLPINEHGLSFHLCFLWFLPSVFCSFRFFMSLVKFIYKHFVVVVNGIVFFILIFWGFCLLLVYINTTDVCFFFFFWSCCSLLLCECSLVAVSRGRSLLPCVGFSLRWLLLLWRTGSRCSGLRSCSTWAW